MCTPQNAIRGLVKAMWLMHNVEMPPSRQTSKRVGLTVVGSDLTDVGGVSRFEAVDLERQQADHLLAQLQLCLRHGRCLGVGFTVLCHVSAQQEGGWR